MTKFRIYKLHFKAPLHISDLRDDASISQKTIHSDTFHAALISCLAKVGETIPEGGDLGCVISDLFPYYQKDPNSSPVYFLPMPLQTCLPNVNPEDAKKVKRVQWVDAKLYSRRLNGKPFFSGDVEDINHLQSTYLTETNLPEDSTGSRDFIKSEVMQRVSVKDRTGQSDALPYYVDRISFRDESGLYFLVDGDNTMLLDQALKVLEMEGIGTATDPYTTLRKNAIYAFLPGSVFFKPNGQDKTCIGKIADLTPSIKGKEIDHRIWRNGKSIMLPIII